MIAAIDDLERGAAVGAAEASLSMGHNSDGQPDVECDGQRPLPFKLSGSQKKTAFALRQNAERMIAEAGVETIGFLTLTVGDFSQDEGGTFSQVFDSSEASRRINNLNRSFLPALFERAIIVTERHKSGAIHFHLIGALRCGSDIRTGYDFEAVKRGDYSSAATELRALWKTLRERLPGFGFGRAELEPIRKTGEAVAAYVSKYVEKNLFNRTADDKGKKLVRYLGWEGGQMKPNEFSWCTPGAVAWRANAERLAALVGVRERAEVADAFGPRWAFRLSKVMNATKAPEAVPEWYDGGARREDTFPEREIIRGFVLREASTRWVAKREMSNGARPFEVNFSLRRASASAQEIFTFADN